MLYRGDDPIQDRSTKNRPVFGLSSSFGEPQALVHVEAEDVLIAQSGNKTHSRDSQNCLLAETVGIVAAVEIDL